MGKEHFGFIETRYTIRMYLSVTRSAACRVSSGPAVKAKLTSCQAIPKIDAVLKLGLHVKLLIPETLQIQSYALLFLRSMSLSHPSSCNVVELRAGDRENCPQESTSRGGPEARMMFA